MDYSDVKFDMGIFEIIENLVLVVNSKYKIKNCNKKRFFGYSKNEFINKSFISFIHDQDIEKFTTKFNEFLKENSLRSHFLKINLKTNNGKYVPYKIKISKINDSKLYLLYLIKRSNIFQTRFDLQKNIRAILETLIETTSNAILITDIQGKIIFTSEKALNLSGFEDKNSFIGKDSFEFIHPEERKKAVQNLKKTIKEGKIEGAKYRFIKKDGGYYHGELNASLIKDYQNNPIGFIGVIKDITKEELAQEKVKESEEKYSNMINNLDLGFFRITWDGKILDCNSAFKRILGLNPANRIENFDSLTFLQINHERNNFFQKLYENDKVRNYRVHIKPVYGKEKVIQLNSHLIRDQNNKPLIIEGTITDITEKHELEEKLRESERKYHTLFDGANDAIFMMEKSTFIECNKKTLEIFGCEEELDIVGKTPWIFSPKNQPDGKLSKEKANVYINNALLGNPQRFYWKHIKKDGTPFDVEVSLNRFILGKNVYIQAIVRDKSSQIKAEKDLKNSEQKYRHLFETSPFSILLLSPDGKIIDFNSATTELIGYSRYELIGKDYSILPIMEEDFFTKLIKRRKQFLRGDEIDPVEVKIRKKNGSIIWVEIESSHVKIGSTDIIQLIGHNVTERKKAENLIKEEFKRLKNLNQMRKDLISRVSHELKTPLMSIEGASELLLMSHEQNLDHESLNLIKMIKKGGKRLNDLVNNLIDISRIEYKKLELDEKERNLSGIIKETCEEIIPIAKKRNLTLDVKLPDQLIIRVDQYRIEQVITNLLSNAIKNTPPNGKIEINLIENDNWAYISVIDTGIGLTKSEMETLFKRFGKIERYGSGLEYIDIQGSGLGLFISKEIVNLHRGDIWVESKGRNKGSKFVVKLPIKHQI